MKIAFIGQKGIPAKFGGVERHVEELASEMAKIGHEVFVYVRNNYTDESSNEYKGVKLIHLPSIGTKHLDAISHTFLASVHSLFANYDVVHFHGIGPASLSWIVKLFKREALLTATFHCQDYHHKKWNYLAKKYLKFSEMIACKIPDKTIAISKMLRDYAEDEYGAQTVVIPNGSSAYENGMTSELRKWELKKKKYVLIVSRLVKHKGVHYAIEAFKQLEDTNRVPNGFKLAIVGDSAFTDDYVEYLKTISEGRKNIVFLGNQSGDALHQVFTNAYLYVQPSEAEGLSISLLEAMGYGLAPLVSDIKENVEPVGDAGFSFKTRDIKDLREKLSYLLNREDEVESAGKKARQIAKEKFSWNSIAQKTLNLYREELLKKEKANK